MLQNTSPTELQANAVVQKTPIFAKDASNGKSFQCKRCTRWLHCTTDGARQQHKRLHEVVQEEESILPSILKTVEAHLKSCSANGASYLPIFELIKSIVNFGILNNSSGSSYFSFYSLLHLDPKNIIYCSTCKFAFDKGSAFYHSLHRILCSAVAEADSQESAAHQITQIHILPSQPQTLTSFPNSAAVLQLTFMEAVSHLAAYALRKNGGVLHQTPDGVFSKVSDF